MIRKIFKMDNQMVVVFDEHDEQMPEYQGWVGDAIPKLVKDPLINKSHIDLLRFQPHCEIDIGNNEKELRKAHTRDYPRGMEANIE